MAKKKDDAAVDVITGRAPLRNAFFALRGAPRAALNAAVHKANDIN